MKKLLLLASVAMLAAVPAKAQAATVGPGGNAEGLTYDISVSGGSLNSTSATFLLHISGINNAVTDLEGGRSAVNDFALGGANSLTGLSGTSSFGTFQAGGLNSSGCNGSGNFFCFNGPATNTSPALPANSTLDISFTLNLTSGTFLTWAAGAPAFKIDWLGSQNNYNLVSMDFVGSIGPTPQITPTPLPGAVWMFGAGMGGIALLMRRRKKNVATQAAA